MSKNRNKKPRKPASGARPQGARLVTEVKGAQHFENIITSAAGPVIVDFWAPWCGPCKAMGPVFQAAAKDHQGKARFLKVNTEANGKLARAFNITSIPSLLVFVGNEVVDANIGLTSRSHLDTMVRRALDKHEGIGLVGKVKRFFGKSGSRTDPGSSADLANNLG